MFFSNNRTNIPQVLMMCLIDMRVPDSDFFIFIHILESTLAARQPVDIKSTVQEQGSGRRGLERRPCVRQPIYGQTRYRPSVC